VNAPLPLSVTRDNAAAAVGSVARSAGVDAADLARLLTRHTQGEVLFDTASRGRYATDASIYQIMPIGVFVPRTADDVASAIHIARDLKAPLLARGGGTSQCGQTTALHSSSIAANTCAACCGSTPPHAPSTWNRAWCSTT
jgi:hypothetical protein